MAEGRWCHRGIFRLCKTCSLDEQTAPAHKRGEQDRRLVLLGRQPDTSLQALSN